MQTGPGNTTREGKVFRVKPVSPLQVPSRLRWHRRSSAFIREAGTSITSFKIKGNKQNFIDTNCFHKSYTFLRPTHQKQTHRNRMQTE